MGKILNCRDQMEDNDLRNLEKIDFEPDDACFQQLLRNKMEL